MLYLLLSILFSALISILMRISEKRVSNNFSMLAFNYITCILLAALSTGPSRLFAPAMGFSSAVLMGMLCGALFLSSFALLQWNVAKNGMVMASTFMKLGVLVPTVLSILLYREMPKIAQILGLVGALAAILIIHFEGGESRPGNRTALLLLLVCGGLADFMAKVFEQLNLPELKGQYLFFTFLTALVLCVVLILWKRQKVGKMEILFGILLGIPNYYCSSFLLQSLDSVPAVVAYPTYSVGTIILVTIASLLLFREKLSRHKGAALLIILVSLILLNL